MGSSILAGAVILNLVTFVLLAVTTHPGIEDALFLTGSVFLIIFVCLHGFVRYGWSRLILFFAITFAIAWSMESLSIATGFPFGNYHYTERLGEKVGEVPILIMPAYFFIGHLAWTMANTFAGNLGTGIPRRKLVFIPLLAAALMALWDLCFDPYMSTISGRWVWEDGGVYYGVPLTNIGGWLLTEYLIFQVFALFVYRFGRDEEALPTSASYWYLVPVMYAVQGVPYFLLRFFRQGHEEILQALSWITLGTMFLMALLNLIVIFRARGALEPVEQFEPQKLQAILEQHERKGD